MTADDARNTHPVHCFADDALGDLDAVGLAAAIRSKAVSPHEALIAAIARAEVVQPLINGVDYADYDKIRTATNRIPQGLFAGVPTFVKDNVDVKGFPTNYGSAAFEAKPARKDSPFTTQFRSLGLVVMGKSRLPEFGFSASTEYASAAPVRNPWGPQYSAGASSGGSAALVAAGVVPIAHANDGGGSIRIPAAVCGLVGLKPSRGRLVSDRGDNALPVRIVSQGVVSRSVRDTAHFLAGAESYRAAKGLPPIGLVEVPHARRLRVGVITESVNGARIDEETAQAVQKTAAVMAELGHHVEETATPVSGRFADDFASYWGLLGLLISSTGSKVIDPSFDKDLVDPLTRGLAQRCRKELLGTPGVILRLKASVRAYRKAFETYDVLLSPTLAHTTPRIGYLSPSVDFDELFERLQRYVAFTPLNNAVGSPAISLPAASSAQGLPIGIHLSGDVGAERTLLEIAYELEEAIGWARIQDAPGAVGFAEV